MRIEHTSPVWQARIIPLSHGGTLSCQKFLYYKTNYECLQNLSNSYDYFCIFDKNARMVIFGAF